MMISLMFDESMRVLTLRIRMIVPLRIMSAGGHPLTIIARTTASNWLF